MDVRGTWSSSPSATRPHADTITAGVTATVMRCSASESIGMDER